MAEGRYRFLDGTYWLTEGRYDEAETTYEPTEIKYEETEGLYDRAEGLYDSFETTYLAAPNVLPLKGLRNSREQLGMYGGDIETHLSANQMHWGNNKFE